MKRFNQATASRQRNMQRVTEKYTEFVQEQPLERVDGEYSRGRKLLREVPDAKFVVVEKPPKKVYVEPPVITDIDKFAKQDESVVVIEVEEVKADNVQVVEVEAVVEQDKVEEIVVATQVIEQSDNEPKKAKSTPTLANVEVPVDEQVIAQEKLSINRPVKPNPLAERVEKPAKPLKKKGKSDIYVPVDNDPIVDKSPKSKSKKAASKPVHAVELEELLIVNQPLEELLEEVLDDNKSNK